MGSIMITPNKGSDVFTIKTTRDAQDTLDLRYGLYSSGTSEPKRFIVFLNGRTEWIEKYDYLPTALDLPSDCGFLTLDHRGQGASGGTRAHVDTFDSYAQDVANIIAEAIGTKPYAILAHSMGGLIGLYGVLAKRLHPQSMVLSSPLLGLPKAPVPHFIAQPVAQLAHLLKLGRINTGAGSHTAVPFAQNLLTHNAILYDRMKNSSYPVPTATYGWVMSTFAATDFIFQPDRLKDLRVPTLVMGGSSEAVVDREAFGQWVHVASRHAQTEVQLRMISGGRHELFSEVPEYFQPALAAARNWLSPFLNAADSGASADHAPAGL